MITLKISKDEAQAIVSAGFNVLDDLENLKSKNRMSVGWKIMFDDLVSGLEKCKSQYYKQIEEINEKKK